MDLGRRTATGSSALLCAVALLAACAAPGGGGGPSAAPSGPAARGAVHGRVVRPPGGDPRAGGGGMVPVNGDAIEAADRQGRVVATATTAIGGTFELSLPAGAYRVTEGICGVGLPVEVRAGTVTTVVLTVPNAC